MTGRCVWFCQLSQLATSYSPRAFEALEQRLQTGVPLPFVFYTA